MLSARSVRKPHVARSIMVVNKPRQFDSNSGSVAIPKDDLRLDGLINDDDGEIDGDQHAHIRREGPRKWTVEVVEDM